MRWFGITLAAIALQLNGCVDPASGTSTSANLKSMPDLHCVDAALRAATDPALVHAMEVSESAGLTSYSWDYGGSIDATLEIQKSATVIRYLNTNVKMGTDASRAERFDPIMRRVNDFIERRCNVAVPKDDHTL